jgi:hypothetical protein
VAKECGHLLLASRLQRDAEQHLYRRWVHTGKSDRVGRWTLRPDPAAKRITTLSADLAAHGRTRTLALQKLHILQPYRADSNLKNNTSEPNWIASFKRS